MNKTRKTVIIILFLAAAVLITSAFALLASAPEPEGPPVDPGPGTNLPQGVGDTGETGDTDKDPDGDKDKTDTDAPGDTPEPGEADGQNEPDEPGDTAGDLAEPPQPEPPVTDGEAAETLGMLGIMPRDADLDAPLTRGEALTYLVRLLGRGYPGQAPDWPCPFTDVDEADAGAVGFAAAFGLVDFSGDTGLHPEEQIETSELLAMAGRLGLPEGYELPGDGAATQGSAARVILELLGTVPEGESVNVLTRLVETGAVSVDAVTDLGLGELIAGADTNAVTAAGALEKYASALVTVSTRDIMMDELGKFRGSVAGEGVVAVPLEALRGAMYAGVTCSDGTELKVRGVIAWDADLGVAYLDCGVAAPEPIAAPAGSGEARFAITGSADIFSPALAAAVPGLPVADRTGGWLGITTLAGVSVPEYPAGEDGEVPEILELYDLGLELWPEECPPVRPRGIDPSKPMTAMTYDDGPKKSTTNELLDILEENGAVATFFEVGTMLKNYTGALERMEELGCQVANHTYNHKKLTTLTADEIRREVESVNDLLTPVLGHGGALVRTPYGSVNDTVKASIDYPIILWNVDTLDWQSRNAEKVMDKIREQVADDPNGLDGDIVLMHSIHQSTIDAARTLYPWLNELGYQTVTVEELAFFRGVTLENGKVYYSFHKKK